MHKICKNCPAVIFLVVKVILKSYYLKYVVDWVITYWIEFLTGWGQFHME